MKKASIKSGLPRANAPRARNDGIRSEIKKIGVLSCGVILIVMSHIVSAMDSTSISPPAVLAENICCEVVADVNSIIFVPRENMANTSDGCPQTPKRLIRATIIASKKYLALFGPREVDGIYCGEPKKICTPC